MKRLFSTILNGIRPNKALARAYKKIGHLSKSSWLLAQKFDYRRPSHALLALLIVLSIISPVANQLIDQKRYQISDGAAKLLGKQDQALTVKLTEDIKSGTFNFNQNAIADKKKNTDKGSTTLGASTDPDKPSTTFSATKKGKVTITDVNTELKFSLTPAFSVSEGKMQDGRLVYPVNGEDRKLIYSPQVDGIKEDVILAKPGADKIDLKYQLELPEELEARLMSNGSLGIYSADSSLFGNITYGADKDRELVEKSRRVSAKNQLQFVIPAPVIKDSKGVSIDGKYQLDGQFLTVKTEGLRNLSYPVTIDPSTYSVSGNGFGQGNAEGGVDVSNGLTRGLSGGGLRTWKEDITPLWNHSTVVNNNYIYVLGGCINSACTTTRNIQYAPINPGTGTVGTWIAPASSYYLLPFSGLNSFGASVHNGYLYVVGGCTTQNCNASPANVIADAVYIKFAADGSFIPVPGCASPITGNSWCTTASLPVSSGDRYGHATTVYDNGAGSVYLYSVGGCTGGDGNFCATGGVTGFSDSNSKNVYKSLINNSNGSLDVWTPVTALPDFRYKLSANIYTVSGTTYLYAIGGCAAASGSACSTPLSSISFAKLDSSGNTVSQTCPDATTAVWCYTSAGSGSFGAGRYGHGSTIIDGNLYISGGCSAGACTTFENSLLKGALTSSGDISAAWTSLTGFTNSRYGHTVAANGSFLYIVGGLGAANTCRGLASDICGDVQFTKLASGTQSSPDCTNGAPLWCGLTNLAAAGRYNHASVTYVSPSGTTYIYVIGGHDGTNFLSDVRYAPLQSTGKVGSWVSTTGFGSAGPARSEFQALIYNNNLYILGGNKGGGTPYLNDVLLAPLNNDGTVGTWRTTTSFAIGGNVNSRSGFGTAIYNRYIYIVGGYNGGVFNNVLYAKLNPDGSIPAAGSPGEWKDAVQNIASPGRWKHGLTANNGYLYASGGCTNAACTTITSSVEYSTINSDGSIGNWISTTSLPEVRAGHASLIYNGFIYVFGGASATNAFQSTVYYAPVLADGTVGDFNTTAALNAAHYGSAAISYKNNLYITGGCRSGTLITCSAGAELNQVIMAPVSGIGDNVGWTQTTTLPNQTTPTVIKPVYDHTSFAANGYLFVVGGCNSRIDPDVCQASNGDIYKAPINANGTVGTWLNAGTYVPALGSAVSRQNMIYAHDNLYIIGGMTAANVLVSQVIKVPISGSSIGTPEAMTGGAILPVNRSEAGALYYNGYIYSLGGCKANRPIDTTPTQGHCNTWDGTIYSAKINADGSLASWVNTGVSNPGSVKQNFAATTLGKYAYISDATSVFRATLQDAGGISAWSSNIATMTTSRNNHHLISYNGYLYNTGMEATDDFAAVDMSDGSIGGCALPPPTCAQDQFTDSASAAGGSRASITEYRGFFFRTGGLAGGNGITGSVAYTKVNHGGSGQINQTGNWSTGTALPTVRSKHATVAIDNRLYVMGGQDASATLSSVQMASLKSDGSFQTQTCPDTTTATWCSLDNLPSGRRDLTAATISREDANYVTQNYLYAMGGCTTFAATCTGFLADVIYTKTKSNGTFENPGCGGATVWCAATNLPSGRFGHSATVYKNSVYITGGCTAGGCSTATNTVLYGTPTATSAASSGNISDWRPGVSQNMPASLFWHASAAYGGYLYVLGGQKTSACEGSSNVCREIYSAPINSGGDVGVWKTTAYLPRQVYGATAAATNGYLYLTAGATSGGGNLSSGLYVPILTGGQLGQWEDNTSLAAATRHQGAALYRQRLYLTGGMDNAGASISAVSYGSLQVLNRIGRYSLLISPSTVGNQLIDFCNASATEGFSYSLSGGSSSNLTLAYQLAGTSNKWHNSTTTRERLEPNTKYSLNGSAKYLFLTAIINDGDGAVFPDSVSSSTTVSGLSLSYRFAHPQKSSNPATPSSSTRLRHGAFFTGEQREALDTNPNSPSPDTNNFCSTI